MTKQSIQGIKMKKNLNERKIYAAMSQPEKARLLFQNLTNQDESEFQKIASSGKPQRWIVNNHEARLMADSLVMCALAWGIDYWTNQAQLGGFMAMTQTKDDAKSNEAMKDLKGALILNQAYLAVLNDLEEKGLLKDVVLKLSGVTEDDNGAENFAEIMPDDLPLLNILTDRLYQKYSSHLTKFEEYRN